MLNKIKIGPKLLGSYAIVGCLSIVIGIIGISSMREMNHADQKLYDKVTVPMGDFVTLSSAFSQVNIILRDVLRSNNTSDINKKIAEINEVISNAAKSIEDIDKTILTDEGRKVMNDFLEVRKPFKENMDQVIALARSNKIPEAYTLLDGPFTVSAQAEQKAITNLVELKKTVGKKPLNKICH